MQTHLTQLAEVEARLQEATRQLHQQQSLLPELDFADHRQALVRLLTNGLRVYCWLEGQQQGLRERIGEELPLPQQ